MKNLSIRNVIGAEIGAKVLVVDTGRGLINVDSEKSVQIHNKIAYDSTHWLVVGYGILGKPIHQRHKTMQYNTLRLTEPLIERWVLECRYGI